MEIKLIVKQDIPPVGNDKRRTARGETCPRVTCPRGESTPVLSYPGGAPVVLARGGTSGVCHSRPELPQVEVNSFDLRCVYTFRPRSRHRHNARESLTLSQWLTGRIGQSPILPVKLPVTINTMFNFDVHCDGDGVGRCKHTLKLEFCNYNISS